MSQQGTIRRYTLIIEKISRKQYPNFAEIKQYLFDMGFEISERTLQRDIEYIRNEFGVEIHYDRITRGYYIDMETSLHIDSFYKFLEIANTAELFSSIGGNSKDALHYVSFGDSAHLKGIELLPLLLEAIRDKKQIAFEHENFHTEKKKKEYILNPYLLREYQNRWYVVGVVNGEDFFLTFGIDRIHQLKVMPECFKPLKNTDPSSLFDDTIGVIHSSHNKQRVVLSFTPTQGKYIKTLPLHKSQQIMVDNEKECRISLDVVPNFELSQLILMHGSAVKVIEPTWLAKDIQENLKTALAQYKKL